MQISEKNQHNLLQYIIKLISKYEINLSINEIKTLSRTKYKKAVRNNIMEYVNKLYINESSKLSKMKIC